MVGRDLPPCTGPKLGPFVIEGQDQDIIFKKHLGSAVHSHVFEVIINGSTYALKMFKFLDPRILHPYTGSELAPINLKTIAHHKDPFYSECRAFGRLKETGREDLAVHCYGYIITNSKHEEDVCRQFRISNWDRSEQDEGKPVRAIVKELVRSEQMYVPKMVPRMMRELRDLNGLGIQVWDVKDDMYLGGVLIDLSQARTVPHIQLDLEAGIWKRDRILGEGNYDYECFDAYIIDEWNDHHDEHIWDRFEPNSTFRSRLRSSAKGPPKQTNLPFAALYDWKRESRKRKAKPEVANPTTKARRIVKTKRRKKS
ncbi:hypothetical protein GLAREA_00995 [Glarea lozoyensis ATCC 20868]|uniref:Uncharacterized protein n=1 Tax=Glarea lozoyensis (strain ATCC 20868 / MF5171) TaxID=1116229 RepID=S3CW41_GLAL2|nr:uncharacterized protein GLAREA_00995 [Glarea lozoyensis ATCC 20868]EPE29835.1 hypothetical protein GLAREA_00995 [Glarea lozoyensis ATCC 20868]